MKTIQFGRGITVTLRKVNSGLDVGIVVPDHRLRAALAEVEKFKLSMQVVPGLQAIAVTIDRIMKAVLEVMAESAPPPSTDARH